MSHPRGVILCLPIPSPMNSSHFLIQATCSFVLHIYEKDLTYSIILVFSISICLPKKLWDDKIFIESFFAEYMIFMYKKHIKFNSKPFAWQKLKIERNSKVVCLFSYHFQHGRTTRWQRKKCVRYRIWMLNGTIKS